LHQLITRDFFTHPSYSQLTLHNDLALVHLPEKVITSFLQKKF
jgi:hypothetical protein